MKKIILSLAAVLAFTLTSDAQTRKGTVLLGAGSELSEQNINTLSITPKVGYFVQDGIAIGALVNFQNDNTDKNLYELNNKTSEIGVFGRYYVSNNLFTEISLSSKSVSSDSYDVVAKIAQKHVNGAGETVTPYAPGAIGVFDPVTGEAVIITYSVDGNPDYYEVVENSQNTLNFNLGLGYTIVWREHFAVEPFMNLVFMNGEETVYVADDLSNPSYDLKTTDFNLGINFSLFF